MKTVILRRRRLGRTSVRGIAAKSNNDISIIRNDLREVPADTDLVIRWGCTSNTGVRNILNTARAIHQVNDKTGFRRLVQENSPTKLVPKTWFSVGDWLDEIEAYRKVVIRPNRHAQGRNLLFIDTIIGVDETFLQLHDFTIAHPEYYISEFIPKVAEYRVYCIQGRVVAVAEKTPANPNDIAWNVAQGGRFDNVRWDNWNLKAVRVALEAFNMSELDFGGVDVMVDGDNNAYVIEINSAPTLTSEYRQECFAKAFDYIIENGKERIPLIEERGGYRKFIHPALTEKAILV